MGLRLIVIQEISEYIRQFQNKTLVLWGAKRLGPLLASYLGELGVEVEYFCDNDSALWGKDISGVVVLSPEQLEELSQKSLEEDKKQVVVQLSLSSAYEKAVKEQVKSYAIQDIYTLESCFEALKLFFFDTFHEENKEVSRQEKLSWIKPMFTLTYKDFYPECQKEKMPVLVGQPPKVGDITMMETLKSHGIDYFFLGNQPHWYDKSLTEDKKETIKIITSIREPIARDLSFLFHQISVADFFHVSLPLDIHQLLETEPSQAIQYLFDLFLETGKGSKMFNPLFAEEAPPFLHCFFDSFSKHIVDIRNYPMDTEKGYCVIKEGNMEVFVYQLEQLNHLLPELSLFLGRDITALTNANEAKNKWVAPYYKKALEELKFPRSYVEAVYDDPYVRHCYGDKKIEQFKEKWMKNV